MDFELSGLHIEWLSGVGVDKEDKEDDGVCNYAPNGVNIEGGIEA